jgi:hypothetical protein
MAPAFLIAFNYVPIVVPSGVPTKDRTPWAAKFTVVSLTTIASMLAPTC